MRNTSPSICLFLFLTSNSNYNYNSNIPNFHTFFIYTLVNFNYKCFIAKMQDYSTLSIVSKEQLSFRLPIIYKCLQRGMIVLVTGSII